jgi:hypothetical protein
MQERHGGRAGRRRRGGTRELAADPDPAVGLDLNPIPRLLRAAAGE